MPFANGRIIQSFRHRTTSLPTDSDGTDTLTGNVSIQAGGGRMGGDAFRATALGVRADGLFTFGRNSASAITRNDVNVWSVYARWLVFPNTTDETFLIMGASVGNQGVVYYKTSTGTIGMSVGGSTFADTGIVAQLNVWYRFDLFFKVAQDPRVLGWMVTRDGDSTPLSTGTLNGPSEPTTSTARWIRLGSPNVTTQTVEIADVLGGGHTGTGNGDYPITPSGYHHAVIPVFLLADGTHAVGTGTFRYTDNNGGAFTNITNGTTDSHDRVDEIPTIADGNGADDWVEKSAGTTGTDRVEWAFGNPYFNGTPLAVHTHVVVKATTSGAGSCELYQREGSTDAATQIHSAAVQSTTAVYRGQTYPTAPDGTAWDLGHLAGAKVRFSSTVVSPISQVKSVYMDVAYQYQPAVQLQGSTILTAGR